MRPGQHDSRDNLTIAALCGITSRRASEIDRGISTLNDAVAELQAESTDPHLLAHAIAGGVGSNRARRIEIVLAAGADPEAVDELAAWLESENRRLRR